MSRKHFVTNLFNEIEKNITPHLDIISLVVLLLKRNGVSKKMEKDLEGILSEVGKIKFKLARIFNLKD